MVGDNLSPFWVMMKNLFGFTFEKQNSNFEKVYDRLKMNPHIPVAKFVAADENSAIFEYAEGDSWYEDEFPKGENNVYILGQYVGYNHQKISKTFGMVDAENGTDFFEVALEHMRDVINEHFNSDEVIDKKVRGIFEQVKASKYENVGYSLIMVDMCADQFLYKDEDIYMCVDLDSYVIGPVEWELAFLNLQIEDWESFKAGYETYQNMPEFEKVSKLFYFLMALNCYNNKAEMEDYWLKFFI